MRLNPDVLDRPYYSLALHPADAAVRVARKLLKAALAEWDASHLADDAALVASELVTNAVRCARSVVMTVHAGDAGRITLEVWDDSPEPPVPRGDDPTGGCGRGLVIVEALADVWGWEPADGGKCVWAVLGTHGTGRTGGREGAGQERE